MAFTLGFLVLLLATLTQARPFGEASENEDISEIETERPLEMISYKVEEVPNLYLVLFGDTMTDSGISGKGKAVYFPKNDHQREKRNIVKNEDDDDDLETAAGTNVLRPLFVYRQQLAYRERIKKGNRRGVQLENNRFKRFTKNH